jgi:Uma2 family endonuclease
VGATLCSVDSARRSGARPCGGRRAPHQAVHRYGVCGDRRRPRYRPLAGANCEIRAIDLEAGVETEASASALGPLGARFDAIVVTNYLHRPLFAPIEAALAPAGVLIYETFAVGNERFGRPRNPNFLLRPGELIEAFAALTIVAFEQGEVTLPRPAFIQRIAALAGRSAGCRRRSIWTPAPFRSRRLRMPSTAQKLMSLDEFLTWEREQPERYEFADGVVTMMTGGSLDHSTIASNLRTALSDKLRGTGCMAFRGDAKVIANGAVRYPDLSVTCSPVIGRDDIVPEPVLIVEVISASTERLDRGRKKLDYFATPSVRQYAMVEQDERLVDLYTRSEAGWINEVITGDAVLKLSSIAVELPLDTIYEDTELDATRRQAGGEPVPAA